ncbi:hypothetical protein D3C80_2184000 [compost metagenome]
MQLAFQAVVPILVAGFDNRIEFDRQTTGQGGSIDTLGWGDQYQTVELAQVLEGTWRVFKNRPQG